jgi:divalent metal cation (Fe/Co/Zn/Cd) transporter
MTARRHTGDPTLEATRMCLTCGCEQAHLKMGDNITYEDLKRIADGNHKTVAETLDIIDRTVAIDRQSHKQEYAETSTPSAT